MRRYNLFENYFFPLIIASTVFLFLPRGNYYIFGQDSFSLFGQFNFYSNPLYEFNNGLEMVYFAFTVETIFHFIGEITLSQNFLVFIATYISTVGFFDLIDVIAEMRNKKQRLIGKSIGAILFLYNPFTLSVTWPHFLGWSILIMLSPIIISFLTDTIYNGINLKRFSITSLLTILFVAGFSGSFLPFFLIILCVFIIFIVYNIILNIHNKPYVTSMSTRVFSLIIYAAITLLWSFVPFYLLSYSTTTSLYSGNILIKLFESESQTTVLPHVLSMTGYSWIYSVQNSYPWINELAIIQTAAYMLLLFLPSIFIIVKKYYKILPLSLVALLAVVFSTGSNFPFGFINEQLLLLGGPFLFLANAYYFTIQFYVLFISVLLSLIFYKSISRDNQNLDIKHKSNISIYMSLKRINYRKVISIFIILFIAATFFYPFAKGQVYQSEGTNIDEINIDNGLLKVKNFLHKNFTSPDYYTLLVPTSSRNGATYLSYNNKSTFVDSRGLISSIDPYPLIWQSNSNLANSIENYLSSNNLNNMRNVFDYLHIRFIIFVNNYTYNNYMLESYNGNYYNFQTIYKSLENAFGSPMKFGNYEVFTNRYSKPDLELIKNPVFVNTTLSKYIDFLSSINSSIPGSGSSIIYNAVISNKSFKNNEVILKTISPQNSYEVPSNDTFFLMDNGSIENYTRLGLKPLNGFVKISPIPLVYLKNESTYISNMDFKNNTLYSNTTSYIAINNKIVAPSTLHVLFKVAILPYSDRNFFNFELGNLTISAEFVNVSDGKNNMDLQLTAAFTNENYYAWNNFPIPIESIGKNISLTIQVNTNYTMDMNINVSSIGLNKSVIFYYGSNNYRENPGFNSHNFELMKSTIKYYTFQFMSGGKFPTTFYQFYLNKIFPIKYIFTEHVSNIPKVVNSTIKISIYGDYNIYDIDGGRENTYLYFFGYPQGIWNLYTNLSNKKLPIFSKDGFSLIFKLQNHTRSYSLTMDYKSLIPLSFGISVAEILGLLSLLISSTTYDLIKKKSIS